MINQNVAQLLSFAIMFYHFTPFLLHFVIFVSWMITNDLVAGSALLLHLRNKKNASVDLCYLRLSGT